MVNNWVKLIIQVMVRQSSKFPRISLKYVLSQLRHFVRVEVNQLIVVLSVNASHSVLQIFCIHINRVNLIITHIFQHETS